MAAVSAGGKVGELRALNHLVDRLDQSVDKLAEKERQVWFDSMEWKMGEKLVVVDYKHVTGILWGNYDTELRFIKPQV